jgi:acetyl-CoA synthetase
VNRYWRYRRTPAHRQFAAARDLLLGHRLDLDRARAEFRWPRPATFNWALEWFDVVAADDEAPALDFGDRTVSFAELSRSSDSLAVWLAGRGVCRGDRLLVVLDARTELWECLLAALKLGAVVIPTYPTLTRDEAADRIERGRTRHVITLAALADRFPRGDGLRLAVGGEEPGWEPYEQAHATPRPYLPAGPTPAGDLAFGYFTSGTTARPKLVGHSHSSYPIGHLSSLYWNGLRPGDRHLNVSAPGWAKHSWSSLFVPWTAQATLLVPPPAATGADLVRMLAQRSATSCCAPPSGWRLMRPYLGLARPALREATSAGEPLDAALTADVARHWGVAVRDGYGQTETTALVGTPPGAVPRPSWLGRPLPGYDIVLRDPDTGAIGDSGELCVDLSGAPAGMMLGCLGDGGGPPRPPGPRWYGTGDLGERDRDGYLRVWGRRDDVFKCGGHRISPYELEAVLRAHPHVAEVAVVPVRTAEGLVPHAVVVPASAPARHRGPGFVDDLLAYAAGRLAPELCPRSVSLVDEVPRTASGKIRRSALAARFTTSEGGPQ